MTPHQQVFAALVALALAVLIVDLVRRRRLRVEYAWLWLATGAAILVVTLRYEVLIWVSGLIGSKTETTTLFLFGLLFLVVMGLHFSIRFTDLTRRHKNLVQEVALLRFELARRDGGGPDDDASASRSNDAQPPARN